MKHMLLVPFLALLSCNGTQDKTALYQDAFSAVFEYLSTELGITDPSVSSTFAMGLEDDVIRQDANDPERKRILETAEFDIEEAISIWEMYKGKDLSVYVAENHAHFLVPKDNPGDRGTHISFSAPIFNSDTSIFLFYMVFETNEENKKSRFHQYMLFGKTEDSWKWQIESRVH